MRHHERHAPLREQRATARRGTRAVGEPGEAVDAVESSEGVELMPGEASGELRKGVADAKRDEAGEIRSLERCGSLTPSGPSRMHEWTHPS
jgi:hypothetical protein